MRQKTVYQWLFLLSISLTVSYIGAELYKVVKCPNFKLRSKDLKLLHKLYTSIKHVTHGNF